MGLAILIDLLPLGVLLIAMCVGAAANPLKLLALGIGWWAWNRAWSLVRTHDPHVHAALAWRTRCRKGLRALRIAALGGIVVVYTGGLRNRSDGSDADRAAPILTPSMATGVSSMAATIAGRFGAAPADAGTSEVGSVVAETAQASDSASALPFAVTGVRPSEGGLTADGAAPLPFAVTGTRAR